MNLMNEIFQKALEISKPERRITTEHFVKALLSIQCNERKILEKYGINVDSFTNNKGLKLKMKKEDIETIYDNSKLIVTPFLADVLEKDTVAEALIKIINNGCIARFNFKSISEKQLPYESIIKDLESLTTNAIQCNKNDEEKLISEKENINLKEKTIKEEQKKLFKIVSDENLEKELKNRIIGQDYAISTVVHAIKRKAVGLSKKNSPIGSFLFVGPTGVGKTELAKQLSILTCKRLIKLDMSEYMTKIDITKLIGSPPAYVGYENGGILTNFVKKNPSSIVLFDEIEKANNDIYNILLQIMDEGRLSDNKGEIIDFTQTIVILTSNIGSQSSKSMEEFKAAVTNFFTPEILNRFSSIVAFNYLSKENMTQIAKIYINDLIERAKENDINISVEGRVAMYIAKNCDLKYGGREIQREVIKLIENQVVDKIFKTNCKDIEVNLVNDKLVIVNKTI